MYMMSSHQFQMWKAESLFYALSTSHILIKVLEQKEEEKMKLSLYADDRILNVEVLKTTPKKTLLNWFIMYMCKDVILKSSIMYN